MCQPPEPWLPAGKPCLTSQEPQVQECKSTVAAAAGGKNLPPPATQAAALCAVNRAGWHGACLFMLSMRIAPKIRRAPLLRRFAFGALAVVPLLAFAEILAPQDTAQLEALAKSEAALQFPKL